MTAFSDLPLDILPGIVQNVVQSRNLVSSCLVNKAFCKFTQPFLYHTITVLSWHPKDKVPHYNSSVGHLKALDEFLPKIIKLFRTLSSSPGLAKHVRKLGNLISADGLIMLTAAGPYDPMGNQKSGISQRGLRTLLSMTTISLTAATEAWRTP